MWLSVSLSCLLALLLQLTEGCSHNASSCPATVDHSEVAAVPGCFKGKCGKKQFGYVLDYQGTNKCCLEQFERMLSQRKNGPFLVGVACPLYMLGDTPAGCNYTWVKEPKYCDYPLLECPNIEPCYCGFRAVVRELWLPTCDLGEKCSSCGEETKPCACSSVQKPQDCGCNGELPLLTNETAASNIFKLGLEGIKKEMQGFFNDQLLQSCNNCGCKCDGLNGECSCGCDCTSMDKGCWKLVPYKYPLTVTTYEYNEQCCIFFESGYSVVHQDCSSYVKVTKTISVLINKPEPCTSPWKTCEGNCGLNTTTSATSVTPVISQATSSTPSS